MKSAKVVGAFVMFVMLIGASASVHAGDACRNVKFQFKNQRNVRIRVFKIEYFNRANNRTQTEDVANLECGPGATCTTGGDNLRDSEGEDLTNIVFFFNDQEADGGWSRTDIHTQNKVPVTQRCSADMIYRGSPIWTINP